jgi:uncharacterized protein YgiM (DUF1202 family)
MMIRLTLFLCAGLFLLMLVGGQDRGQLRPGLAAAGALALRTPDPEGEAPTATAVTNAVTETLVEEPTSAVVEAEIAPAQAPVAVAVAEPLSEEPLLEEAPVFTLSSYAENAPPAVQPEAAEVEVRYITGRSVNVRQGPGTENAVLAKLTRGEAVTVVWADDTGWSRIRIEGDGLEGYVSSELLAATAP